MHIITHRGLEPSKKSYFSESSYEAFKDQLARGYGIEFDPNFIKDNRITIAHDATLSRITKGKDMRSFSELTPEEITGISLGNGRLCFFEELMELIRKSESKINAMHVKGGYQQEPFITILIDHIKKYANDLVERFMIFDLKPEVAREMKKRIPDLHLAPSVADVYDIERYNGAVKGTLISLEDAIQMGPSGEKLYDWVWLDEWDRRAKDGSDKTFYNEKTFTALKNAGYKISLVTPELHGTSPGLLGGEAHEDAANTEKLMTRIKEIIDLKPDAICTDYPEEASQLC